MEITIIPNKILARKISSVSAQDIKNGLYKELILNMKQTMIDNNGIGLAANQVGKDLSIFVIDEGLAKEYEASEVFFNPEITEYSKDEDELEEGCLSVPEFYTQVKRSKKIKIKFVDEDGNKKKIRARGFLARVLQHETDHLGGLTIKNRVKK